ncbi:sugar ABC transporter substrate-binding protein [Aeromicrobium sp. zg-Y1379]|nr:sugar ABC transporter substrate-binding protein [Aeromicrobium wangtongii]
MVEAVKARGAKYGFEVTAFDGKFDAQTQVQQVQNAITQKKFNAMIIVPQVSALLCKPLTQDAPAANIVVVTVDTPVCDAGETSDMSKVAVPGVLAQVGDSGTTGAFIAGMKTALTKYPDNKNVLLITPPTGTSNHTQTVDAFDEALKPAGYKVVAETVTADYSTASGLKGTQDALQAHPEINLILGPYAPVSYGASLATKAAGREDIPIIDSAVGDKLSMQWIQEGKIDAGVTDFPQLMASGAVDALKDAFEGKDVPRVITTAEGEGPKPETKEGTFVIVTPDNVEQWMKYSY